MFINRIITTLTAVSCTIAVLSLNVYADHAMEAPDPACSATQEVRDETDTSDGLPESEASEAVPVSDTDTDEKTVDENESEEIAKTENSDESDNEADADSLLMYDGNTQGETEDNNESVVNEETETDSEDNIAVALPCYGLPVINIELQGTTLSEINKGSKNTKYPGNRVDIYCPDDEASFIFEDVEIKGRGNSTWTQYSKKPYQIKFREKTSLFGFPKAKKYILLANSADQTLMKNALISDLSKTVGYQTYEYKYIDLYIDGSYLGNYLLTQKIEISKSMINLKDPHGVLAEVDQYAEEEDSFFVSKLTGAEVALKEAVSEDDPETMNNAFMSFRDSYLKLEKAAAMHDWQTVKSLCDAESFAKYYLLSELAANGDASVSSFYLYKDGDGDLIHAGPMWDMDHGFGHKYYSSAETLYVNNDVRNDAAHTSLLSTLMEIPEFHETVSVLWRETLSKTVETQISGIRNRYTFLEASAAADQRINGNYDFYSSVLQLENWLKSRQKYLDMYFGLAQPLEEGIYKIFSQKNGKILGSTDGSIGNKATISYQTELYGDTQLLELEALGDGAYLIRTALSSKYFELTDHERITGTNLRQNRYDGTMGQKWKLINAGNNTFYVMSFESGQVLDIRDGQKVIQTSEFKGSDSQKFIIQAADYSVSEPVKEGVYFLTSKDVSKVMGLQNGSSASGASLKLNDANNPDGQLFEITASDKGYYKIRNVKSGLYLDVGNGRYADGTDIYQWPDVKRKRQDWGFHKNANGTYVIYSAMNGRVIDIEKGVMKNGTNLRCYRPNATAAQNWQLVPVNIKPIPEDDGNVYKIVSCKNTKYCLDIAGGSREKGANLHLYLDNNTLAQRFELVLLNDGYYTIKNKKSGLVLDVAGGSVSAKANVRQWRSNGSDAQKWRLIMRSDRSVIIVNKKSGMVLDITKGVVAKRTNIQQYRYNRTTAQLWYLR